MIPTKSRFTRRRFLAGAAAAGATAPFITSGLRAASSNGKLQHASFGAAGMARADMESLMRNEHFHLVAVADVDERNLKTLKEDFKDRFPDLRVYADWRELLAQEGDRIDSVNVSTPDHMHGPIGLAAMAKGKHVYGQKPLAQNLWECRQLMLRAREKEVMTQMGIQVSSDFSERLAVRLVQDGVIGKIKEVHTFSNKEWGDMEPRPERADPVPAGFHWDHWLGVAAERPFIKRYDHPANWRKRRDFGTGTLGDMGCHIFSAWFRGLALNSPLSVKSTGPKPNADNWAINGHVEYTFPGTAYTEDQTVKVIWYDGNARPPQEVQRRVEQVPDQGNLIIGTEGVILHPHQGTPSLFPREKFKGYRYPRLEPRDHYMEFIECCREGKAKPSANFDYAGPLTEAVLLGCLASVFPEQTLEWDAASLAISNSSEANRLVKRQYREGWQVS